MSSKEQDNIQAWINMAEPKYYGNFVMIWLAFNRWYKKQYRNAKTDAECINKFCTDGNVKNRMGDFLCADAEQKNPQVLSFKEHIAEFHDSLEQASLKYGNEKLSLTNAKINFLKTIEWWKHQKKYTLKFVDTKENNPKISVFIKNIPICPIADKSFKLEKMPLNDAYNMCNNSINMRNKTEQYYVKYIIKEAVQKRRQNIISTQKRKNKNFFGDIAFIEDTDIILEGLIRTIYQLRCMLFHGEIMPDEHVNKLYQHAYFIMLTITAECKKIK